jgi:hypothetical protein
MSDEQKVCGYCDDETYNLFKVVIFGEITEVCEFCAFEEAVAILHAVYIVSPLRRAQAISRMERWRK